MMVRALLVRLFAGPKTLRESQPSVTDDHHGMKQQQRDCQQRD